MSNVLDELDEGSCSAAGFFQGPTFSLNEDPRLAGVGRGGGGGGGAKATRGFLLHVPQHMLRSPKARH